MNGPPGLMLHGKTVAQLKPKLTKIKRSLKATHSEVTFKAKVPVRLNDYT